MNTDSYKLYLVTHRYEDNILNFLNSVNQACQSGVSMVQLREKEADTRTFYNVALKVKQITDYYQLPLVINDRVDICLAVGADGVHIGDDELPVEVTRKLIGKDRILGVSAKSVEQAKEAEQQGADYLGVGAVFPTDTKKDSDKISIETLKKVTAEVSIPVVAIGGIKESNLDQLTGTNIAGVSLISEIMQADDVAEKVKRLNHKLDNILKENSHDH